MAHRILAAALSLLAVLAPPAGADGRVVAVGDVHGAYEAFVEILRTAGLVDAGARWAGGDATLVQLGDFLDRGAGVVEVMDLLMRLQDEAPRHGGRVIVLMGNHEVMNLLGILRDVSPDVYARLAGPGSAARRDELFAAAAALYRRRPDGEPPPPFEEDWKRAHPPGYLEYCELLAPESPYGRWLRGLPVAVRLGDALYMHAGLSPEMEVFDPDEVTARVHADLAAFDDFRRRLAEAGWALPVTGYDELEEIAGELATGGAPQGDDGLRRASRTILHRQEGWTLTDHLGPLWFRGFTKWKRVEGAYHLATLKRVLGVEHFVVGHTPARDREIHQRFDGGVFLVDTGMLSERYAGGRPSALERAGETWTALYLGDRDVLQGPGGREAVARGFRGPDGEPLPFATDEEALDFLRTAEVVSRRELGQGTNRTLQVLLERAGVSAHAAFRTVDLKMKRATLGDQTVLDFHDSFRYEVAAYELSRLLGLGLVPPTVQRRIDGEEGSLQLWVEGATTESERVAGGAEPPDWPRWYRQLQILRVFDRLIYNFDRNRGNILIDADWNLWLIDHTRSFRVSAEVPEIATVTQIEEDLWRRLKALERAEVASRLEPWVDDRQVRTLMKRRDRIVDAVDGLIARFGAEAVVFDLDVVPARDETVRLADSGIESFLEDLPDASVMPPELVGTSQ